MRELAVPTFCSNMSRFGCMFFQEPTCLATAPTPGTVEAAPGGQGQTPPPLPPPRDQTPRPPRSPLLPPR